MRILLRSSRKAVLALPFASSEIAAPLIVVVLTARLIRALYRSGRVLLLIVALLLSIEPLDADPVQVHKTQGTFHGFLVLKTPEGKTLASGDLVQVAHGDRVSSRL